MYIIDANNLAYALAQYGLIDVSRPDLDQQLIETVKPYLERRSIRAFLVFDGWDIMGDRYQAGLITIIHTPKDSFYKCADDKIVELVREYGKNETVVVVTDDNGVKDRSKRISQDIFKSVYQIQASDLAEKIRKYHSPNRRDEIICQENRGLSPAEEDRISQELLELWH